LGNFNDAGASFRPTPCRRRKTARRASSKNPAPSPAFHLEVEIILRKVSNPMIYAAIHQFGSEGTSWQKSRHGENEICLARYAGSYSDILRPDTGIPPRPFFQCSPAKLTPKAEEKSRPPCGGAIERQLKNSFFTSREWVFDFSWRFLIFPWLSSLRPNLFPRP